MKPNMNPISTTPAPTNPAPVRRKRSFAVAVLGLLFVGAATTAGYLYQRVQKLQQDPQVQAQEEVRSVVEQVGKLMVLPEGEEPTLATVSDPEKLKDQAFFAKAKLGDRLLIYTNARKAILYDPVANKIIDIAPVNIGQAQTGGTVSGATTTNQQSNDEE